jgi:uncharacterized protein YfaS (alpha-2-macroglobulin family)
MQPPTRLGPIATLAAVVVLSGCRCGKEPVATGPTLAPLPTPPAIVIAPDGVPTTGLTVVAARPHQVVGADARPTITFSKPVVALASVEEQRLLPPPATLSPALPGEWRWIGSASVEFVPSKPLPFSTRFTVTVPAGLKAVDGSALKEAYSWSFDTPRPKLESSEPSERWAWVEPNQTFKLVFNQPVMELQKSAQLLVGADRTPWPITVVEAAPPPPLPEEEIRPGRTAIPSRRTQYELKVGKPLPLATDLVLVLAPTLRGKEGPLTADAVEVPLRTYGPARIESVRACLSDYPCPYGPLVLVTSNVLEVKALKPRLRIEPHVDLDWDRTESHPARTYGQLDKPYTVLAGKFRPGTTYTVSVGAGATDIHGQSAPAAKGQARTADLEPQFDVGPDQALLEAKGDGALPVRFTNLSNLEVRLWALQPAEMARFLAARRDSSRRSVPAGEPVSRSMELEGTRNIPGTRPLKVRELLGGKGSGLFHAVLTAPEIDGRREWQRTRPVTGQITDLAVHTKLGATSGIVWVTRVSDGKPVPGAALALYDADGAVKWQGTSDADGLARVPGLATLIPATTTKRHRHSDSNPPFAMVSASLGGDLGVTLADWTGGFGPWGFSIESAWAGKRPEPAGFLTAERGIYRPGDTVMLKGLVRYRRLGALTTPPRGTMVDLRVTDARGKEVLTRSIPVSEYGTFNAEVPIDPESPLGTYSAIASAGVMSGKVQVSGSFRVEEYRPPQFKVDVSPAAAQVVSGDAIRGRVLARYLFGGAMPGAPVRWTATRTTQEYRPPGNETFSFGIETWDWNDESPGRSSEVVGAGEAKTDAQGALEIEVGKAEAPGGRSATLTLEAEVADVNRQRIANRTELSIHPAALYAGVRSRSTDGFPEINKPVTLEAIAVTPAGERQRADVVVTAFRRDWKFVRKKTVGDRWETLSEPVEERAGGCTVKTEPTPVTCLFTPKQPGLYVIQAEVTDSQKRKQTTRTALYVVGEGWVSWQRNDSDRIDLIADKPLYDVGETAKVLVKSPFPSAEAVVSVEREGVTQARRVVLKGAATTLDIPVGEGAIPNVYVGVVLVRGRVVQADGPEQGDDPGRPQVRVGYVQLKVEKKSKRLNVEVTPDQKEYRPRNRVKLGLRTTDWKGAGAPAEVAVWAVDEGVLRLTNYEAPDPLEALHPIQGLSVRLGEPLIHLVKRQLYADKGMVSGGGGGGEGAGAIRSRFKTTVLFAPSIVTGADGRGAVEFELPDNLTTYRILAVAVDRGERGGRGGSSITVNKPLLAMPALPRLARTGDALEAGVVVHSPSGKVTRAEVTASVGGPLQLVGEGHRSVALPDGKAQEVRFKYRAEGSGEAVLRFSVSGGGEQDAVEQRLPVKVPSSLEAVALAGETQQLSKEELSTPNGVRPDVGGLEITMASTVLGGYGEAMRQLVDYPYGCLEQLSSRLVPFVALRELHGIFKIPWQPENAADWVGQDAIAHWGTRDPDEVVRKTVRAIEALQRPDGGYGYWSSDSCSSPYGSAYAVLALGRAAEVGYAVDREALRRGQGYLARVANGNVDTCSWWWKEVDPGTRAFALFALARTHAAKTSSASALFARRSELPFYGKAMLADALYLGGGDRAQAKQLTTELLDRAQETAGTVHLEEMNARTLQSDWSSDTRTTAIALGTLVNLNPDHPYVGKMARYLTQARGKDGKYRTTQESAFALMALTEVVRVREKAAPNFQGRALLAGKPVAEAEFRGRSLEVRRTVLPMSKLPAIGAKSAFEFVRQGSAGMLSYGAVLRYAPAQMPRDALDRGLVVQRWIEPYAGGGQLKAVKAGELVRIKVRVGTPAARQNLALEVPFPAGLEAVDTSLATTARLPGGEEGIDTERDEMEGARKAGLPPWVYGFWNPFNHTELRDDRALFFASELPPGVHTVSVVARATTPGDFLLVPARAEAMYQPEVFGRSDGRNFQVLLEGNVAAK